MTHSGELRSGKGAHDENFPVASRLIKRRHRPAILAFYEFVRVADDIADHSHLTRECAYVQFSPSEGCPRAMHRTC
jgi:phytoene/squalene synthetase